MSQTPKTPAGADERLPLRVKTSDSQSEIVVLDARGRFIERGFGPERTFLLERGIYRVKVLTGSEYEEKPVVLTEALREPVQFAPVAFASPVPLVGTSTSHEYHMEAASTESRKTHVADGVGSSLFFLVRDWTPYGRPDARRVTGNPATGLSLHAVVDGVGRKVADLAKSATKSLDLDPWSACTVDVAPGVYELRLELPAGGTLHQSIVASSNWQTQAFIFMRGYPTPRAEESSPFAEWRADLARTSILLSPVKGFSHSEPLLRLAELARVALASTRRRAPSEPERRLLPDDLRTLLRDKFENPMLGIYAGHLLLLETTVDLQLLREVVRNLRQLLGAPHPDVEALALRAEGGRSVEPFKNAPMLRRSWSLIVDATVDWPELVSDSLARSTTSELWSEGPWYIRRTPSVEDADRQDQADLSDLEEALAEDLGVMKHVRRARRAELEPTNKQVVADGSLLESPAESMGPPKPGDVGLKQTGVAATPTRGMRSVIPGERPPASSSSANRSIGESTSDRSETVQSEMTVEIDSDHLRSIARRFGLPQTQLQRVLGTLEDKLGRMNDAPGVKVIVRTPSSKRE